MSMRGRRSLYIIWTRFIESLKPKNLTKKGKYVSNDYLGNTYYEIEADPSSGKRTPQRWFKPPSLSEWDRPLPPEWNAWLRLRRTEPPTDEEIQFNLMIESKKKQFDKQIDSKTRTHSYSSFPIHEGYEETPGQEKKPNNSDSE